MIDKKLLLGYKNLLFTCFLPLFVTTIMGWFMIGTIYPYRGYSTHQLSLTNSYTGKIIRRLQNENYLHAEIGCCHNCKNIIPIAGLKVGRLDTPQWDSHFMKLIPLTQGKFAQVDDADYERVSQYKWYADCRTKDKKLWYARNEKLGKLHRFVVDVTDPAILVDHGDGDGLNCQRLNLRSATYSQNGANRRQKSTKRYLGVYAVTIKGNTRYRARCKKNGIRRDKLCRTEEQAALAYNAMAVEYHGAFARLNKVA